MPGEPDPHPELPVHPERPVDPDLASTTARCEPAPAAVRPAHRQPLLILLVAVGGFAGALARYGVAEGLPTTPGRWPWGTFLVNVAGALLLGALLEGLARRGPDVGRRQRLRLLLGTGFCGAYTTYSTLAVETELLRRHGDAALAAVYPLGSAAAGLAAAALGIALAARYRGARSPA